MGYFRIANVVAVTGTSVVGQVNGSIAPRAWGFVVPSGATGTITFKDGGTMPAEVFAGQPPVPAQLQLVSASAGTIYVLQ